MGFITVSTTLAIILLPNCEICLFFVSGVISFISEFSPVSYLVFFLFLVCDQNYESSSGFINSPNYPNDYPTNVRCYYLIRQRDPAVRIILSFQRFSLEEHSNCKHDSVKIYDGNSIHASQLGYSNGYCGNRASLSFTSTGSNLLIVFTSDASGSSSGFSATYKGKPNLTMLF